MNYWKNATKNLWQWALVTDSLFSSEWIQTLSSYTTLWVGFSGGLDSTVLIQGLAKDPVLSLNVKAVHVHHGLSLHADAWQEHCQAFCKALSIPLVVQHVTLDGACNIEENARTARYQVFSSLLGEQDCLLLAHHRDDQAETLLLQLFRGAGIDGLSAMAVDRTLAKGRLFRPFLAHSRQTLKEYALRHHLTFVEDESNQNGDFSRNYLRHQIMPLLQLKWPNVVNQLVQTAGHCQQAKENLDALAEMDCQTLSEQGNTLDLSLLQAIDHARLVNVLRAWIKNNRVRFPSFKILNRLIEEVVFASKDCDPVIQWGDVVVRRHRQTLYLLKHKASLKIASREWPTFPLPLELRDLGCHVHATPDAKGFKCPAGQRIEVRFREGGELFYWHGQHKPLKKLLQQWGVPSWQRDRIPLLYIDDELAVVVGFAIGDEYYSTEPSGSYRIDLKA